MEPFLSFFFCSRLPRNDPGQQNTAHDACARPESRPVYCTSAASRYAGIANFMGGRFVVGRAVMQHVRERPKRAASVAR